MNDTSKQLEALGFTVNVLSSAAIIDPEWGDGGTPVIRSRIRLSFHDSAFLTTDYTQGIGHHPDLQAMLFTPEFTSEDSKAGIHDIASLKGNLEYLHRREQELLETLRKMRECQDSWGNNPYKGYTRVQDDIKRREAEKNYRKHEREKHARVTEWCERYAPHRGSAPIGMANKHHRFSLKHMIEERVPHYIKTVTDYIAKREEQLKDWERRRTLANQAVFDKLKQPVKMDVADPLHCILMDARGSDQPFEDWCADYGYDDDSRKAEAIWKQCRHTLDEINRCVPGGMDGEAITKAEEILQDY